MQMQSAIPTLPSQTFPMGLRLGPWSLQGVIGRGAFAWVYRAEDAQGRCAAIKVLRDPSPTDIHRFRREMDCLSRLRHPHIVQVLDHGEWEGMFWMATALLEGDDLQRLVLRWRQQAPPNRWEIVEQITWELVSALGAVHQAGWVHRDIKPSNVMWCQAGGLKLLDFGGVCFTEGASEFTQAGELIGTLAYMAPEQILEEWPVDARADLYALGGVLYTLLTLQRPFEADCTSQLITKRLTQNPVHPKVLNPTAPDNLCALSMRLLDRDPSQRPASAAAVQVALRGVM